MLYPLLKILTFLLVVFLFVFNYVYYFDSEAGCKIRIIPSLEFSNSNIKEALKVLKFASPEEYATVCAHVDVINTNVGCGGFGGGCFYASDPKTIFISTSQRSLAMSAAIIVHETCHVIQGQENRSFDEQECYEADDRVLRNIVQF